MLVPVNFCETDLTFLRRLAESSKIYCNSVVCRLVKFLSKLAILS